MCSFKIIFLFENSNENWIVLTINWNKFVPQIFLTLRLKFNINTNQMDIFFFLSLPIFHVVLFFFFFFFILYLVSSSVNAKKNSTGDWCNFESVFHGSVEKLLIRRIMIMDFISLRRISVTRVRGRMMEIVLASLGENFKDTERKMSESENEKRDLSSGEISQRQFF